MTVRSLRKLHTRIPYLANTCLEASPGCDAPAPMFVVLSGEKVVETLVEAPSEQNLEFYVFVGLGTMLVLYTVQSTCVE